MTYLENSFWFKEIDNSQKKNKKLFLQYDILNKNILYNKSVNLDGKHFW